MVPGTPSISRAAVVLAGGRASRLGGLDKAEQVVGGSTLLARAVRAAREWGADPVVVVGPPRSGYGSVTWTREDPPGAGPACALAAGMLLVPDGVQVAVLAADLPGLSAAALTALPCGSVAVDPTGREQWLVGVHSAADLRHRPGPGASLRSMLDRPGLQRVPLDERVLHDCDTPADLFQARSGR